MRAEEAPQRQDPLHRRRRPRLPDQPLPGGGWRRHDRPRRHRRRQPVEPQPPDPVRRQQRRRGQGEGRRQAPQGREPRLQRRRAQADRQRVERPGPHQDYDVIIDGTDNFPTRHLVGDACVLLNKPNVYGRSSASRGWSPSSRPTCPTRCRRARPVLPLHVPRAAGPGQRPEAAPRGVIGVLPGIIGTLQANEVIKLILGIGTPADREADDVQRARPGVQDVQAAGRPVMPDLRDESHDHAAIDYEQFCGAPGARSKSLEETQREVIDAKNNASGALSRKRLGTRRSTSGGCRRGTTSTRSGR